MIPATDFSITMAPDQVAAGAGTSVSNHIREEDFVEAYNEVERLRGDNEGNTGGSTAASRFDYNFVTDFNLLPRLIEKSVIIHRDENGFGLRVKGQQPAFVEHVHENGAAWRAGVRRLDRISKVNGTSVGSMDHKEVVLMFKSCTRFVGLTLLSPMALPESLQMELTGQQQKQQYLHHSAASPLPSGYYAGGQQTPAPGSASAIGTHRLSAYSRTSSQSLIESMPAAFGSPSHQKLAAANVVMVKNQSSQQLQDLLTLAGNNNNETTFANKVKAPHQKYPLSPKSAAPADGEWSTSFQGQYPIVANGGSQIVANFTSKQTTIQQIEQQRQQVVARRSESVSFSPSDLISQSQAACQASSVATFSQGLGSIALLRGERRISVGEPTLRASYELQTDFYQRPDKRMAVCINCRALISRQQQQDESINSTPTSHLTCLECQLMFGIATNSCATRPPSRHVLFEHQRQRSYGSLRDQRQQEGDVQVRDPNQVRRQAVGTSGGGQPSEQQPVASIAPHFKLSQSASTNSLPADTGGNKALPSTQGPKQQPNQVRQPTTNKRLEIIREFIDTEKAHTDRLRCLDELFYRPLKVGGFMTSEQLRMVFSCHRTLYKIHRQIHRILLSANYSHLYTTEPMIGSALLEIFEGDLKRRLERAACSFCVAQSTNADLLNKLTRRDTKVGEFLAQVTSQQMVGRLGIKDLLASCFQRLTKYPLLLENLLKATPHPEPVEPRKVRATSSAVASGAERGDGSQCSEREKDSVAIVENENEDEPEEEEEDEEELEEVRNSRRMLAISLAEEREFIERALQQSRQILVRVNDSVKVAISHNKLKEIWKRTDKYPGVPLIDITKQQVVHEGSLTLRLSKRSFDVYVLVLSNYIIILTREGQDKYRLKFFTPDGKSSNNPQSVYSPVFVIDEHLTTRDAATDENGFYLLCKRKDDSRIYEFASRSPAERLKWRDRIQWTIERQMSKGNRRPSCESSITKSSSEISTRQDNDNEQGSPEGIITPTVDGTTDKTSATYGGKDQVSDRLRSSLSSPEKSPKHGKGNSSEPTKIEGTISYVEDDGIVMPSKMESSRALVDQAIQVNIFDSSLRKPVASN